jgi:quercetin dioxygenase-like cupin family protein
MTPPRVVEIADGREFHGLGAPVVRLVHPKTTGSNQLGVSIALMPPGSVVKRHRHDYEEAYFVVDGTGVMFLDGVGDIDLHPGLSVYIPPNTIHGQVNTSQTHDLRIVCSLSPPPVEGEIPELFE